MEPVCWRARAAFTRQLDVQLPMVQFELLELLAMVSPAGTDDAFKLMTATGGRGSIATPTISGAVAERP